MASLLRPRKSLRDLDDKILINLVGAMQNKATPSETFVARESLAAIWTQELLKDFIRLKKPGFRDDDFDVIQRDFVQIISILCYIGWPDWTQFGRIFLGHYGTDGERDRTDASIGKFKLEDVENAAFLGSPWAHKFLSDQYIFSPIILREGESLEFGREWRLPFINEESNEIRQGGYGSVTKEIIPGGYYQRSHGLPSHKQVRIARKRFAIGQYFRFEVKNLKHLRSALAHHDRILPYLATVTVGNDFNIISPLADMDLEQFLTGEHGRHPNNRCFTMKDLVIEAANVADALNFLHEDLRSPELGLTCCHRDLKPANILVFFEGNSLPTGKWKITDFGISSIRQTESTNTSVRHTSVPLLGPYQAPEVCSGRESGRRSDVWSFGCILVRVLALGLQGRQRLIEFDTRRGKLADGIVDYDHDYFHRDVPAVLNPHIQAWVEGLPGAHNEYTQEFLLECQAVLLDVLALDFEKRPYARTVCTRLTRIQSLAQPRGKTISPERGRPSPAPSISGSTSTVSTTPGLGKFLIQAIKEQNIMELRALLDARADAEEVYDKDRAMIHAILTGNVYVLSELFSWWPNLDLEGLSSEGSTPLKLAAETGNAEMVELLLRKGVNIDAPSASNMTPLMAAVRHGHVLVVKVLLQHRANPMASSAEGMTSLHYAAWANVSADIIRHLMDNMDEVNVRGLGSETPFFTLVKSYVPSNEVWRQKFHAMLGRGADVNIKDDDGNTPLSYAVKENYVSVARKLFQAGAVYEGDVGHHHPTQDMKKLLKEFKNADTRRNSSDTFASSSSRWPRVLKQMTRN